MKNEKKIDKILTSIATLNGIEKLDIFVAQLIELRSIYSGDVVTQWHINEILDKLYYIKY